MSETKSLQGLPPASPQVRLEWQLTQAEFAEAFALIMGPRARKGSATLRRVLTLVVIGFSIGVVQLIDLRVRDTRRHDTLVALTAWTAFILLGSALIAAASVDYNDIWKLPHLVSKPKQNQLKRVTTMIAFAVIASLFSMLAVQGLPGSMALVAVPYLIAAALLTPASAIHSHRAKAGLWRASINYHERWSTEVSDQGIWQNGTGVETRYSWTAIRGFRETQNLILLYLSPLQFLIIPKRAFSDLDSEITFRALTQNHIPEGQWLPRAGGFPVVASTPRTADAVST